MTLSNTYLFLRKTARRKKQKDRAPMWTDPASSETDINGDGIGFLSGLTLFICGWDAHFPEVPDMRDGVEPLPFNHG